MDNDHYEKTYRDAREALYLRGRKIGKQTYGQYSLRYCYVDGLPLSDREVFKQAWSADIADEILRNRVEHIRSLPQHCPQCDRLWEEFAIVTAQYLKIVGQQRIKAEGRDDPAFLPAMRLLERQAAENRQNARKSVRDHLAAHVGSHAA